jgi:hypothetical protein
LCLRETIYNLIKIERTQVLTEESIKKMKEAKRGSKNPNFEKFGRDNKSAKDVLQFDLDGNLIASYCSVTKASEINKINISSIGLCCKGQRNTAGGFRWKYKNKVS